MMLRDEADGKPSVANTDSAPQSIEAAASESPRANAYTSGALVENQPKLIDFVPQRSFAIAGIFVLLVAAISLINVAHFRVLPFAESKSIDAASFNLNLDGGLLAWVSSFLLLGTSFFCFQVYQVRKFRADDYSGSYRVWIWLAVGFIVASIDATAQISPIVASLIATNWENGFFSSDKNVWLIIVGLPALTICSRLAIELWRSRVALGSISIAAAAYGFATVLRFDFFPINISHDQVVEANSLAIAHSSIFFMVISYARFVVLEAEGKIVAAIATDQIEENEPETTVENNSSNTKRKSKVPPRVSAVSEGAPIPDANETPNPTAKKQFKVKHLEHDDSSDDDSSNDELSEEEHDSSGQNFARETKPELELMGQQIHKLPTAKKGRKQANKRNANQRRAA